MTTDSQAVQKYESMKAICEQYGDQFDVIEQNDQTYLIEIPKPEIALESPRYVITWDGIHTIFSPNAGNLVWSTDYQLLERILLVAHQRAINQLGWNTETYLVSIQIGRSIFEVSRYLLTDTKAIEELDLRKPNIENEE